MSQADSEYVVPKGSSWCHDGKDSKITKAMIDRVFAKADKDARGKK
jgi:hypothetical protein